MDDTRGDQVELEDLRGIRHLREEYIMGEGIGHLGTRVKGQFPWDQGSGIGD